MYAGVYLPHGWVATRRPLADVATKTRQVADAGFNVHIHNVGTFDTGGGLRREQFPGIDQWVSTARTNAPGTLVVGWLNGTRRGHVNVPACHGAVAQSVQQFVAATHVDGVLLDFEPFTDDDAGLVGLLAAVRASNPDTWVGICAPGTPGRWSPTFARQVAAQVDVVSPMLYDTSINDPDQYAMYVRDLLVDYRGALHGMSSCVLPSLPAYKNNLWHDPAVENIETATAGVRSAGGQAGGAAVYWWWEMTAQDKAQWVAAVAAGTFG